MDFQTLFQESWFRWVAGLSFSLPLMMLVLTEILEQLKRRDSPLVEVVKLSRQWIVPLAAMILLLHQVMGLPLDLPLLKCFRTAIWLAIIVATLSAMNAIIFKQAQEDSWQAKVPSILIDLGRTVLVLVGLAIIFANVWGADLEGLLTALGVGSLVLGLALQDSMGNLFSGIALLFERPFSVGDWLEIEEKVGRVVSITWRSVHLRTPQDQLIIVPSSVLAQGSFFNYSRPSPVHGEELEISFSYDDPPNKVLGILEEIAQTTDEVLAMPKPVVQIRSYNDFSIGYMLRFFVADYGQMPRIKSVITGRIWYAAQRYGLTMPYPIQAEAPILDASAKQEMTFQQMMAGLQALPSLHGLTDEVLGVMTERAELHEYGNNEVALNQGEPIVGIALILRGKAKVLLRQENAELEQIGELAAGDIFGERLLLGQTVSDVTVKAGADLQVLLFDGHYFETLLEQIPTLATVINETLETRRRAMKYQQHQSAPKSNGKPIGTDRSPRSFISDN
jgi:small-conductance mechanosensitive channel/CRP-like cAMP-binding protein